MTFLNPIAIYAEMKEGLLADSTDYASKPLRDQLKRELPCIDLGSIVSLRGLWQNSGSG